MLNKLFRSVTLGVGALLAVSACSATPAAPGSSSSAAASSASPCKSGKPAPTIALIMPNNDDPQYEEKHKPIFETTLKEISPNSKFIYFNSEASVEKQQTQAQSAMTQGAQVISFVPNDVKAAATIVNEANSRGIKVINLGRLVQNAPVDFLISYDPLAVGRVQGETLIAAMKARGLDGKQIVQLNGAPSDDLAVGFKAGAHEVLDAGPIKIGAEYDNTDWTPATFERQMDQAITALGKENIGGILAVTDGAAGAAIAAMKRAGMDPTQIPITGLNADNAGLQRILVGEQLMTVYKSLNKDEQANARVAVALGCGDPIPQELINASRNNGTADVPTYLTVPQSVTKDTMKSVIMEDDPEYIDLTKLCVAPYADACKEVGLTQ